MNADSFGVPFPQQPEQPLAHLRCRHYSDSFRLCSGKNGGSTSGNSCISGANCSGQIHASSGSKCACSHLYCQSSYSTQQHGLPISQISQHHQHSLHRTFHSRTCQQTHLFFTMEEVEAGLRRLNSGRSGALFGYTSELLRYGKRPVSEEVPVPQPLLAPCITALFNMALLQNHSCWGASVQAVHQHSQSAPGQPH